MWDLPRPGIKLVSLALQGRFLITGPPGKPSNTTCWEDCPFPIEVLASLSKIIYNHLTMETSLVIQWLRLHASTLGDRGSIPGQETKIPHAVQCSQQLKKKIFFLSHLTIWVYFWVLYCRGPQSLGHRPVPFWSLLGTGPHSRRWVAGKWIKLHLPLPIVHITTWTISPLIPWKKWFSWNTSLESKMLDTTALFYSIGWYVCLYASTVVLIARDSIWILGWIFLFLQKKINVVGIWI